MKKQEKASTATAKCPKCDSKYLVATGYCVSCKKKVAEPVGSKEKEEKITVKESFRIPGTDVIVEAGQEIEILENTSLSKVKEGVDHSALGPLVDVLSDDYDNNDKEDFADTLIASFKEIGIPRSIIEDLKNKLNKMSF